ncbi:MAG: TetR/AcrR family transcriptional regulator [Solirubrobacteraceae bacterium]
MSVSSPGPAFTRLGVDERRAQLLRAGAGLFTERGYGAVSMADVAAAAGISKGLLYHYFPSKREFFNATLETAAAELRALTQTDASRPPAEQLSASLEAYLGWIEAHSESYLALLRSASSVDGAESLVSRMREETAQLILGGVAAGGDPSAAARTAVHGWLWFMDGACSHWLEHRGLTREELRDLLVANLAGALGAAHQVDPAAPTL